MTQQQWPPPAGWRPPQQQAWPPRQGWSTQQAWPPRQAWPPQQAWPPPPTPPRRRRPSLLGAVLRTALVIIALMVVASVVRGMIEQATSGPSAGDRPRPQAPAQPGDFPYANEDYEPPPPDMNPPDLPVPRTVAEAERFLEDNPLYSQRVPVPVACAMGRVDARTASTAALQEHLNELMGCLMATWEDPVTAAGFEMPRPPVTVYADAVRTACGVMDEINAAYCAGDQRVYYAKPLMQAFPPRVRSIYYAPETVIAHEFGHAIQARTGILISDKALEQRLSDREARVLSRRAETQADCLSAQFVLSVAQAQTLGAAELRDLEVLAYNLGDDVLSGRAGIDGGHGLGRTRQDWFARGLSSADVGTCNTWVVPDAQVR